MSKQIKNLMEKHPQVFYDVSYEGNGFCEFGEPRGDGTWLYMRPGWYCASSDTGSIHEYTIKDVITAAKAAYQDKERWEAENPDDTEALEAMTNGGYDK